MTKARDSEQQDTWTSANASSQVEMAGASTSQSEDFRTRLARDKRARMRERLLAATLAVCSAETVRNPAVIDDVIKAADVSRGTFYKYFSSLDEAIAELGGSMMQALIQEVASVRRAMTDPSDRVIVGPLLSLAHAAQDTQWGAFVSSINHLGDDVNGRVFRDAVLGDLLAAQRDGVVNFSSVEAAADLLIGATQQAVRRIVKGGSMDSEGVLSFTVMLMLALGMPARKAHRAVHQTWEHLCERHLDALPWLQADRE